MALRSLVYLRAIPRPLINLFLLAEVRPAVCRSFLELMFLVPPYQILQLAPVPVAGLASLEGSASLRRISR